MGRSTRGWQTSSSADPVAHSCQAALDPPDEVDLHRMFWHPADFQNGEPAGSNFRRSDFSPTGHISVHRIDQLVPETLRQIASRQQERAASPGNDLGREDAMSVVLNAGAVRLARDDQDVHPFSVGPEPLPGDPAHCGIRNTTGKVSRSYVDQLRTLLLERVVRVARLSEVLREFE